MTLRNNVKVTTALLLAVAAIASISIGTSIALAVSDGCNPQGSATGDPHGFRNPTGDPHDEDDDERGNPHREC